MAGRVRVRRPAGCYLIPSRPSIPHLSTIRCLPIFFLLSKCLSAPFSSLSVPSYASSVLSKHCASSSSHSVDSAISLYIQSPFTLTFHPSITLLSPYSFLPIPRSLSSTLITSPNSFLFHNLLHAFFSLPSPSQNVLFLPHSFRLFFIPSYRYLPFLSLPLRSACVPVSSIPFPNVP